MNSADEISRRPGDDTLRRYADLVKLHGMKTRFIDRAQELRLLEEGLTRYQLTLDEARGVVRAVAEDNEYVFESEAGRRVEQLMGRHAGKRGLVSKRQFDATAGILRDFSENSINEEEARRQLKRMMLRNGWRPRRAGLLRSRKWFRQIEA